MKGLIASQVVDPMRVQLETPGPDAPASVAIVFLDAGRASLSRSVRRRVQELQRRAGRVRVMRMPIVTRLPIGPQARVLARRLARVTGRLPIVFHCRTEGAVPWAAAMQRALPGAGILLDVRGAWPEEFLFYKGFDGPAKADDEALRGYHHHLANLHRGIEHAGAVLSVSAGMLDWLRTLHVPDPWVTYVPCCVTDLTYDPQRRRRAREHLGWDDALIFAYMGTVTPYQHIADGVAPFFLAASRQCPAARLLCITDNPEVMRTELVAAGVPLASLRIEHRPQAQVADLLVAADCGLILRAPSRINQFSQPTKLGEYLAAGVPVVVSHGTGRLGEMLEAAGAGMAVDAFGVSPEVLAVEAGRVCATLREKQSMLRDNALRLCRASFQWGSYVEPVRAAYRRALGRPTASDSPVLVDEPTLSTGAHA
jgi:glycosyltransferase involved in cell wall biosynthesis